MAFRKYDVFIRQNSDKNIDNLILKYKDLMNEYQNKPLPKNIHWYAELYDSRTLKSFRVYSDKATEDLDIKNYYTTQDSKIIKGVIDMTPFLNNHLPKPFTDEIVFKGKI